MYPPAGHVGMGRRLAMYPPAGHVGMGALPLIGAVSSLNTILGVFGLNSSDPVKDQQRIDRINQAYTAAMSGNTASLGPAFDNFSGYEYVKAIASNKNPQTGATYSPPIYGSQVAYRYAQAKLVELNARVAAGVIGTTLIGQSNIPTSIGGAIQRTATNPLVIGGVLVGVLLLTKRRRRG